MRTVILTLVCIAVMPVLAVLMLMQATLGSSRRAYRMAVAMDQCGNAALGGCEDETISSRTGRAVLDGKWWAKPLARVIDALFGAGHCQDAIGS